LYLRTFHHIFKAHVLEKHTRFFRNNIFLARYLIFILFEEFGGTQMQQLRVKDNFVELNFQSH